MDHITCYSPDIRENKIKRNFDNWFKVEAKNIILDRVEACRPIAQQKLGVNYDGDPTFRMMKRRWGSCSSKGKITLNYELLKTPVECIDYVILHEVCHLLEMNHGRAFYALMRKVMPDWKIHKNNLKPYLL